MCCKIIIPIGRDIGTARAKGPVRGIEIHRHRKTIIALDTPVNRKYDKGVFLEYLHFFQFEIKFAISLTSFSGAQIPISGGSRRVAGVQTQLLGALLRGELTRGSKSG